MKNRLTFLLQKPSIGLCICFQILATLLAVFMGLRLWKADIHVPFIYSGDGILFSTVTKAVGEGSLFYFKNLGAPFQLDFVDFAFAQFVDFSAVMGLQFFGLSGATAINVFWLISICLAGGFATWSFYRLGFSNATSSVLGFAFSITPWTFFRHIGHLGYHLTYIPVTCLVVIFLGLGKGSEFSKKEQSIYFLVLALMGVNNTYYAFFTCLLICFAALYQCGQSKQFLFVESMKYLLAVLVGTAIGLIPGMIYWLHNGKGFALGFKFPNEADIYGLKLRHFLQPIPDHPIGFLRRVEDAFSQAQFPLENENLSVRLGLVGAIGLLGLILVAIRVWRPKGANKTLLNFLSSATLFIFVVGSVGGLGSFFNTLISPQIRCYNRMGVYVAFFSLCTVGLLWNEFKNSRPLSFFRGKLSLFSFFVLFVFLVIDQIPSGLFVRGYALAQEQFQEEEEFVRMFEGQSTGTDMIFQLPFTEYFGDSQNLFKMEGYDNGRLYLHSTKTRWTWGSVSGRDGGWWKKTANEPAETMVRKALLAGFTGFVIDTFAYEKGNPVMDIESLANSKAQWSARKRYAYISLSALKEQKKEFLSSSDAETERRSSVHPLIVGYLNGFYAEESLSNETWRWCNKVCEIWIKNSLNVERSATYKLLVETPDGKSVRLSVNGTENALKSGEFAQGSLALQPSGYTKILLEGLGQQVKAPGDGRKMYFRVKQFGLVERAH